MSKYSYFKGNDVHENCKNCRQAYDKIWEEREKLKQENKQLREALQKCSPYTKFNEFDNDYECCFCKSYSDENHEDCEYIKLTEDTE